jgi:hypothetical protein
MIITIQIQSIRQSQSGIRHAADTKLEKIQLQLSDFLYNPQSGMYTVCHKILPIKPDL